MSRPAKSVGKVCVTPLNAMATVIRTRDAEFSVDCIAKPLTSMSAACRRGSATRFSGTTGSSNDAGSRRANDAAAWRREYLK
jgi:hypothetical protein